jgi:hypothetical protein
VRAPIALALLGAAGCSEPFNQRNPPTRVPTALVIASGDNAQGAVGTQLGVAPTVRVSDAAGPIAGVIVSFADVSGGLAGAPLDTTDARGEAHTTWTLPPRAGIVALEARVLGLPPIRFVATAVPGPPDSIEAANVPGGVVGQYFEPRPYVGVSDRFGNWLDGVEVRFEVREGGGTLDGATVLTENGFAAVPKWRLGPSALRQSVVAWIAAGDSVRLVVTGAAAVIRVSGSGQRVKTFHQVPGVEVTTLDALGQPLPGAIFDVLAHGSSFDPHLRTDSAGRARLLWRTPIAPGNYSLTARAFPEGPEASIDVTAFRPPVAVVEIVAGDRASGLAGNYLATRPTVRVLDADGEPLVDAAVAWSAQDGGAIRQPGVATDTMGVTWTDGWKLGSGTGTQRAIATSDGVRETFQATAAAVPSPAFQIAIRNRGPALDSTISAALDLAARRWESIVLGDLPDVRLINTDSTDVCLPVIDEVIDDLVAFVVVDSIDGPGRILGGAAPCAVRSGAPGLPVAGIMILDVADLARLSDNSLRDLVTHELGHILGFGSLWQQRRLVAGASRTAFAYGGAAARAAYAGVGSFGQPADSVPVDNSGRPGSEHVHWVEGGWRETELMTATLSPVNPLTTLTTASLRDLGYLTTDLVADAFPVPAPGLRPLGPAIPLLELRLEVGLRRYPVLPSNLNRR